MATLSNLAKLDSFDVRVEITRTTNTWATGDKRWRVHLAKDDGESKIEVSLTGPTLADAFDAAWAKFNSLSRKGLSLTALPAPDSESNF